MPAQGCTELPRGGSGVGPVRSPGPVNLPPGGGGGGTGGVHCGHCGNQSGHAGGGGGGVGGSTTGGSSGGGWGGSDTGGATGGGDVLTTVRDGSGAETLVVMAGADDGGGATGAGGGVLMAGSVSVRSVGVIAVSG